MGQKIHPTGFRLAVNRNWGSKWFANKKHYGPTLAEDLKVREYLKKKLAHASVAKVTIERPAKNARITIHSARPGVVIGKKGEDIETLRGDLRKMMGSDVGLNIEEIRKPEIDAQLVADSIAQQLEKRIMSRIGNNPIKLPPKVEVTVGPGEISVKGPLGTLSRQFGTAITVEKDGDTLVFKADNAEASAMHGTLRALVANMVKGVTDGYEKKLALVGVGYRAQAAGDKLNLSLGFSHPVVHRMPKGVKAETPLQTEIVIRGIDKQQVGQVAAEIRAYRPPEPYKGKGVRYVGERVVIKETKKK